MERIRITIRGVVQGVGFRPFLHRLANELQLAGFAQNTSSGVTLEAEGEAAALEALLRRIPAEAPEMAVIEEIRTQRGLPPEGGTEFTICHSAEESVRRTLISPDIGICKDCLRELQTPGDRRYRYPFINCTNCGPRFTIIDDVPYDRAKTAMRSFAMCKACAAEYADISDRRYHAQPDCCPQCGPEVFYTEDPDDGHAEGQTAAHGDAAIERARQALKNGKIIAVKGLGGMHLACRADDPVLLKKLRQRKGRDEKPFALMCRSAACARQLCEVSAAEEAILCSARKPIVLLRKRGGAVPEGISENGEVGIMLPYTPLHVLLLGDDIDALVMTSANRSETPMMFRNDEAMEQLRGIADGFLLHNRDIRTRCDDSLCRVVDGKEYFFRRSRGYVPFPVLLKRGGRPSVLGCGAEQKASFCLTRDAYAFLPQHIGDLKNWETLSHYEEQIRHFEHLFDIRPEVVACDLHPDYLSTEYARQRSEEDGLPLVAVQHHHAHLVSCMEDNGLEGEAIGLIWDGTGLGTDGTVWGGECLIGGAKGFRRVGSLRKIDLPGGDRAIREIDRIGYAMRRDALGAGVDAAGICGGASGTFSDTAGGRSGGCGNAYAPPGSAERTAELERIYRSGMRIPQSSGMGRLFDGVAAVLGIRSTVSYEGQGAILLEAAADRTENGRFACPVTEEDGILRFDWREMIREIGTLQQKGEKTPALAARFMNTLAELAAVQCRAAREQSGERRVVLSGGSFQNCRLLECIPKRLRAEGFEVYHHRRVACNDEGLSLGQARIAQEYGKD